MNLPPLLQNALSQLKQERLAQAESVSRTSRLEVGRTLMAAVKDISALSEPERQQALQKLRMDIARASVGADVSARADKQRALAELKQWQSQPRLFLAELQAGGRSLYTITSQRLQPQQMVQLLIRADGQVQLQSGAQAPQGTGASPLKSEWTSIAQSLRATLPYQNSLKNLSQLLTKLSAQVDMLPAQQRDALLPRPVQQALGRVQQLSVTPEQLAQPDVLRRAIRHSGTFLENALGKSATAPPAAEVPATSRGAARGARVSSAEMLAQLQMPLARQAKLAQGQPVAEEPKPLAETDVKAALLVAIKALQGHQSVSASALKPSAGSEGLIFSLLNLLQKLPPRSKDFSESRSLMLQSLQQQVMAVLSKVQTLQLQTLNLRNPEAGAPVQGAYVELPVKLPDGFSTVALSFQEYWKHEEDKSSNEQDEQRPQKRVKQWEVFMEFDLGEHGQLATRLRLVNDTVSASFWAQRSHTRTHTRAMLNGLRQELEESGLNVTEMQCLDGPPPHKPVKFGYNLVDIQT